MSKYPSTKDGRNDDIRFHSDYKPTINTLIPNRKRQFNRIHTDSSLRQNNYGVTGGSIQGSKSSRKFNKRVVCKN